MAFSSKYQGGWFRLIGFLNVSSFYYYCSILHDFNFKDHGVVSVLLQVGWMNEEKEEKVL